MPFIKIWIHAVWSTKNREKVLDKSFRTKLFDHIHQNGLQKDIFMDCVNGHIDHVHCLFRLKNDQTVSKVLQLLKGESSFWVNKNMGLKPKLQWQEEYFAVSVSESQVGKVRKYIANQEEHHRKKSFSEEYEEFVQKYDFLISK